MALVVLVGGPAAAECNKPLALVTSVDMAPVKDDRAIFVPVTIAGQDRLFMVDTGGAMTEVTPQAADDLKLQRSRSGIQLYNVSGEHSSQFVHTAFKIGNLSADDMVLMVAPDSDLFDGDAKIAGLLAPDIMQHYDLDIDFGAHKLNLISQDHCDGKVVYWKADAVAIVPMKKMDSGHILLPVQIDGQTVTALLDTGAWNTTLNRPVAESQFGLKMGAADTPQLGTLQDRPDAATYHHVFKSLGFEGIAVTNADVEIIPALDSAVLRHNATPDIGSLIPTAKSDERSQSVLLGMNILRHFHIYIAYKEEKVYITPATPAATH